MVLGVSNMTQYRNKHNGRIVTLIDSEITDAGNILHTVRGEDEIKDFIGQYHLEKHWDIIITDACDTDSQTLITSDGEE